MVTYFYTVLLTVAALFITPVLSITSYANEFFTPEEVLGSLWMADAKWAQLTTIRTAKLLAVQGPWTVTTKPMTPPSGDKRDFLSLRPYFWPDCSSVGNDTALTPDQIDKTCPYVRRDGQFNPDARIVNDTGAFQAMSDSVFYNGLAWSFTKAPVHAKNIVNAISTWFLASNSSMNPNLNYAQLLRGPGQQTGSHNGVLDLKCMTKLTSAILVLRAGQAPEWNQTMDDGLNAWVKQYITWLTTNPLALGERNASNNHGTFYYNQLASLQILVGDKEGAKASINDYFNGIYQNQIIANGDQPLETIRTRPYHYRAYNIAGMVTNAKIGTYLGIPDLWTKPAKSGAGIKQALDYAMSLPAKGEEAYTKELLPPMAAIASVLGDPDGKYTAFMKTRDSSYPSRAYYLLSPGLNDSGLLPGSRNTTGSGNPRTINSNAIKVGASSIVGVLTALAVATLSLVL